MMIKQVAHIGITVTNLDNSIRFYRDILGLDFKGELTMKGKETNLLFNMENVIARVAYLNGSNEINCPPVELIQFVNHDTKISESRLDKTSISEICFYVKDIDKTYERLLKLGIEFLSAPQPFDFTKYGFSKSKAVYFKDPDGIILELMQTL